MDDINTGSERVQELGGVACHARPGPGMGWFAICGENEGNEFGLWPNNPSATVPAE